MKVVYIIEENKYYLVNGITELNYDNFSFSFYKDIYNKSKEEIARHMNIIDVHKSNDGKLVYTEKEKQWYWEVFDRPRVLKGEYLNGSPTNARVDVEVIERIPLINKMKTDE